MDEDAIRQVIEAKGWQYNGVSRWIVVTGQTPYELSKMCGVDKSVVSRWLHNASLPDFVQWAFVAFGKLKLYGVDIREYF